MKLKKILLSTNVSKTANDWTSLILRLGFGILMIPHGWGKLQNFSAYSEKFISFMGLGSSFSLALCIFAELICSALLMIGLFSRFATIPLLITTFVIMNFHNWILFGDYDLVPAFMLGYFSILILGPGKYSLDHFLSK